MFDEEKLAWANRHYLKMADPARLAELSLPYFNDAGVRMTPDARGLEFLAVGHGDGERVGRSARARCRRAWRSCSTTTRRRRSATRRCSRRCAATRRALVVAALAEELASAPRLDRERFRAVANRVKARTGQKGKALFHPIRVVLTGRAEGPELDLAVPTIDLGAELPASAGIPTIVGNRERAAAFVKTLELSTLKCET